MGNGKVRSPRCCFSRFSPCPLFSLRNDHLKFGVGPEVISLHLFVKVSLFNELLMSCCLSQMDEELFCYWNADIVAGTLLGGEKNSPWGTFHLLKKQLQRMRTAENSHHSLLWQSSPCLGAAVHPCTRGVVIMCFSNPQKRNNYCRIDVTHTLTLPGRLPWQNKHG